jgi:hypothetical protein
VFSSVIYAMSRPKFPKPGPELAKGQTGSELEPSGELVSEPVY